MQTVVLVFCREVLCRSSLLKQALEQAEDDENVSLSLPTGFLHAWLRGVKLLKHDASGTESAGASGAIQPFCSNESLLEDLQVFYRHFILALVLSKSDVAHCIATDLI